MVTGVTEEEGVPDVEEDEAPEEEVIQETMFTFDAFESVSVSARRPGAELIVLFSEIRQHGHNADSP